MMIHLTKTKKDIIAMIFRSILLGMVLSLLFFDKKALATIFNFRITSGIHICHVLWLMLFLSMIKACIPKLNNHIASGKLFNRHYRNSANSYNKEVLNKINKRSNIGALESLILWIIVLIIIGISYYIGIIDKLELFVITVILYWTDKFCILVWCPFRTWFIKNKCCNSCRIYNWGYAMVISPLIFIPNFFTYSLITFSIFIIIQWEYLHIRYPERFLEISNENLRCNNCLKGICIHNKISK